MNGASSVELQARQARLTAPWCQGHDRNYCKEKHKRRNETCDSAKNIVALVMWSVKGWFPCGTRRCGWVP